MGYGIDIGASAVKVVGVRRTMRGFKLTGAARRRIGRAPSPEEHAQASGRVLREVLGANGRRAGIVGLTGRDINLRVVTQPNTSPTNYRQMMFYELQQARGEAGELYADYCTLREPDSYYPQYLAMLGIGKNSFVDERLKLARGAGVDVRDAVPNSFALYTAYRNAYGVEGGTILLLDIGAENMEAVLVRGGRLIFARNITTGARVIDQTISNMGGVPAETAEARKIQYGSLAPPAGEEDARAEEVRPAVRTAAGQLSGVLQSTIGFARTQLGEKDLAVDKMYLSGGGAKLAGLPQYLQSALKFPVELLDPFKNVDTSALKGVEEFGQLPTDLACTLGLAEISATTTEGTVLSILPEPLKKRKEFYRRGAFLVGAAVVLGAAMLVLTVVAFLRKSGHQSALEEFQAKTKDLNRRIEKMNRLEQEQREATAKSEMLLAYLKAGRGLMDLYGKLRKILPEGFNVTKVQFVDLAERARDTATRRRCLFHVAGAGLVVGEIASDDDDTVTLRNGETYRKSDMGDTYVEWEAPSLGLAVDGEVDENIQGGPGPALVSVKQQLTDSSRGVTAEIESTAHSRDKPGWRVFRIVIRFE